MSHKRVTKTKTPKKKSTKPKTISYKPQIKRYKNMWNPPTDKQLSAIPELYSQENVPTKKKKVYMKFFLGGWTWYILELKDDKDIAFAYTVSPHESVYGYVSLKELDGIKVDFMRVDRELSLSPYEPKLLVDVLKRDGNPLPIV